MRELITATLVIHPEETPSSSQEMIIIGRSSLDERPHKDSTWHDEDSRKLAAVYVGIAKLPKLPDTLHQLEYVW